MFRRHQALLPLMVVMEMQVRKGKMTNQECQLLSCDLAGLEQQLDLVLQEDSGQSKQIPTWMSRKVTNTCLDNTPVYLLDWPCNITLSMPVISDMVSSAAVR